MSHKFLLSISIIILALCCELQPPLPDCNPWKDVDETVKYTTIEYQARVIHHLQNSGPNDYRYTFYAFDKDEYWEYLDVRFINEEECFIARMIIDKWDKLGNFKKVNGESYPKEFVKLKWQISEVNGKKMLRYDDMNPIID